MISEDKEWKSLGNIDSINEAEGKLKVVEFTSEDRACDTEGIIGLVLSDEAGELYKVEIVTGVDDYNYYEDEPYCAELEFEDIGNRPEPGDEFGFATTAGGNRAVVHTSSGSFIRQYSQESDTEVRYYKAQVRSSGKIKIDCTVNFPCGSCGYIEQHDISKEDVKPIDSYSKVLFCNCGHSTTFLVSWIAKREKRWLECKVKPCVKMIGSKKFEPKPDEISPIYVPMSSASVVGYNENEDGVPQEFRIEMLKTRAKELGFDKSFSGVLFNFKEVLMYADWDKMKPRLVDGEDHVIFEVPAEPYEAKWSTRFTV